VSLSLVLNGPGGSQIAAQAVTQHADRQIGTRVVPDSPVTIASLCVPGPALPACPQERRSERASRRVEERTLSDIGGHHNKRGINRLRITMRIETIRPCTSANHHAVNKVHTADETLGLYGNCSALRYPADWLPGSTDRAQYRPLPHAIAPRAVPAALLLCVNLPRSLPGNLFCGPTPTPLCEALDRVCYGSL
jgi:hypothetical protein